MRFFQLRFHHKLWHHFNLHHFCSNQAILSGQIHPHCLGTLLQMQLCLPGPTIQLCHSVHRMLQKVLFLDELNYSLSGSKATVCPFSKQNILMG